MGPNHEKNGQNGRRSDSPFNKDEENWIVQQFHLGFSSPQIQRAFRHKFEIKNSKNIPHRKQFLRVFERFQQNGVGFSKNVGLPKKPADDPIKKKVVAFFKKNPHSSLRLASRKLPFSIHFSTIHRYLEEAGLHPYKPSLAQILSDDQKIQRIQFDSWLLLMIKNDPNFLQIVAFSDEKWFVLHQKPNRQNYRQWSINNPHELLDIKKQGDVKAMCFVCVVDGKILNPVWFQDEEGKNVSVNTQLYIETLKKNIIPQMQKMENFEKFWWQQDGATCHTSDASLHFLREHFENRIISRRADIIWPSSSPDHNPLDYSL